MKMYNKWWIWFICCVIFLLTIQCLFSIKAPCEFLEASWSAGDFITFVGTMVLGYVAVKQTQKANEMSKKLMDIENNRYKLEIRPFVMVTDYAAHELNNWRILQEPDKLYVQIGECNKEISLGIGLTLQNTTASYITAEFYHGETEGIIWLNSVGNQPNRKLRLAAGEKSEIVFYASSEYIKGLKGKTTTVEFILENRFAERYKESFQMIVATLSDECIHKEGQRYIDCEIQNFETDKFKRSENGEIKLKKENIIDV